MKLKNFRVTNFQSVIDSQSIGVDQITCLVGKNEAGKSALLKALYRLNPVRTADADYSITEDYPRAYVTAYERKIKKNPKAHDTVIAATYTLDEDECGSVAAVFGDKFLPEQKEVSITKHYGNERTYSLKANEAEALKHLKSKLPKAAKDAAQGAKDAKELAAALAPHNADPAVSQILHVVQKTGEHSFCWYAFNEILKKSEPKYLYFDEYYQMRGCENINALIQRKTDDKLAPSDEPLLGLVELAGIELQDMLNTQKTQDLKNRLQGASVHLTRQILPYWSQNRHVQLQFDIRQAMPQDPPDMRAGYNIWGEVYDTRQLASTGLGSRSKGFVWFFSFVAWYSRVRSSGGNVILLLDEPGLTLHGRAQGDLLRYFEKELVPNNQVIYSTHSPFMVDPAHFDRVRIVQNLSVETEDPPPDKQGTRLVPDVLDATEDSLFPLQGALGYDIHQTLFIGPNSLLIEGPADMLFIQGVSSVLEREGRQGLSDKWTLTPVGGASKIPTFVRLLTNQKGMNIATLIDIQESDREMIEGLYKGKLLNKANVRTFADYVGAKEADIEDMFEPAFYLDTVNAEFGKQLSAPLAEAGFKSKAPRILQRIEDHLKDNPMKQGKFGHYRPARYFHENLAALTPKLSEDTKKRFEAAFADLNKLLG